MIPDMRNSRPFFGFPALVRRAFFAAGVASFGLVGCSTTTPRIAQLPPVAPTAPRTTKTGNIVPASHTETAPDSLPSLIATTSSSATVEELVQTALSQNPRMSKANFAIEATRGRLIQAGLYPNPSVEVNADELGDRTGPPGIITAPKISQEFVTGGKLTLSQAVAAREVDLSTLSLYRERFDLVGSVRVAFYELYSLEQRIRVLDELAKLAGDAVKNGQALLKAGQISKLDLTQLEVEQSRFQSQATAAQQELAALRKRLAAIVGNAQLNIGTLSGEFESLPVYDLERAVDVVRASHPEISLARMAAERAHAVVHRAEAEAIPNVTLSTGYTRQSQNRSNDWLLGLSVPVPVWNKNQGNILSAKAEYRVAVQEVARVQNDLTARVAAAMQTYSSAKKIAEQYRSEILPKAEETYKLLQSAYKSDAKLDAIRLIQAQRTIAEAKLEYNRALGDAWKAAAELSGLLLEEGWPMKMGVP
jgi:outer membrane protein, heavy metal efflux system